MGNCKNSRRLEKLRERVCVRVFGRGMLCGRMCVKGLRRKCVNCDKEVLFLSLLFFPVLHCLCEKYDCFLVYDILYRVWNGDRDDIFLLVCFVVVKSWRHALFSLCRECQFLNVQICHCPDMARRTRLCSSCSAGGLHYWWMLCLSFDFDERNEEDHSEYVLMGADCFFFETMAPSERELRIGLSRQCACKRGRLFPLMFFDVVFFGG